MSKRKTRRIKPRNPKAVIVRDPLFKPRVVDKPRPRDYKPSIKDFDDV